MANIWNHPRQRNRTHHYCRFSQKMLMEVARLHYGEQVAYCWWFDGKKYLFRFERGAEDIFVHTKNGQKYRIHLNPAKLKYGWRFWFGCPGCGRRCAFLYYVPERRTDYPLFCCDCIRPAYTCQNGSEFDALGERVVRLRAALFGNQPGVTDPCLNVSATSFSKPKWNRHSPHKKKLRRLVRLEIRRQELFIQSAIGALIR